MFGIKLVESKDHPEEIIPYLDENIGKTVGLIVRICFHIYSTGKVLIIDRDFCVLQGIIEIIKLGGFVIAFIKNR